MIRSVILVVDALGLSGKTKAMVDLVVGLDRRKFRPTVVCFRDDGGPLLQVLRAHDVPVLMAPIVDRLSLANVLHLIRVFRRERPDIVHCYNPRAIFYGGLAARLLRVRSILGSLSAFACLVPDRQYDFLPQPLATRSFRNKIRNRLMAALAGRLAVVSSKLGEVFCAYNGIPANRLRLVPYGVQSGEPPEGEARRANRVRVRSALGLAVGDFAVGSVGRLVEQKDYPTQFRGFALAQRTEPRLRMFLAGDGPLRESLEALAVELGIRDCVTFLGYRADASDLFQAMDAFALASKFEPFGIAVLEAKAHGVPIVCAAVNELPEILSSGRCGVLFEAGNPQGFADALLTLTRDPAMGAAMAANGFREARERHGLAAMIKSYEHLYDEGLPGGSS